ncbi:hypothetical protein [Dongia rigui]|uniref:Uncharacterized protein n=1 Tax=Dongia rigui TaxID=940149 RepID=A0ABU5DYU7_9PROT|nr:hypothetical protein [Dongia rigui]MDY0872504.1 hypothetical protein [Dongia rigui]
MSKALALPVDELEDLARRYARRAVETLAEVIDNAEATPATRISAATAILQWGYGRPGGKPKPGEAGEQVIRLTWGNDP